MSAIPLSTLLVRHRMLVLLALGLVLFVPFLGLRDMWYPDEPDIGQVCRAMYDSGDWIAPRFMGEIWVDYPPMIYWTGTAASHLLGGFSEFALRLPNALAAIALVLLTCAVGSRWVDAQTGLWAGLILMTFQQFAYEAINYRPDMLFSLFIGLGMVVYAQGAGERPSWRLRVAAFAFLGLAMLAKGPLGLLLPGLILTLWHGSRREWGRIVQLAPLALVSLAVYLPWFIACGRAMGAESILGELYAQSFERYVTATERGHGQPFYYYLTQIWVDLLWWGPLLPFGVWWLFRSARSRDRNFQLLMWWLGTFVVFLTTAVTKRQVYLLPAYPAAALLLAPWIADLARRRPVEGAPRPSQKSVKVYAIVLAVVFVILAIVMFTITFAAEAIVERGGLAGLEVDVVYGERGPAAVMGLLLLAGALWIGRAGRRGSARQVLMRLALFNVPFYLGILSLILPALNPSKTYKPQSLWIRDQIGSESVFGLVNPWKGRNKRGAFSMYSGAHVELLEEAAEIERFLREHPASLVLVLDRAAPEVFGQNEAAWRRRVVRQLLVARDRYLVVRGAPT